MDTKRLIIVAVGGQGNLLASSVLGEAALMADVPLQMSEIHGMAQRGGSVNCAVRMGNVSGPLVPSGTADVILSTEPLEALRYIQYSNKDTEIITDINPVIPFTVSVGMEQYPDIAEVFKELSKYGELHKIDAVKIAKDAGALITKNIVMLGALAAVNILPFRTEILLDTILENVPAKFKKMNKKAFEGGLKAIKK